MKARSDNIFFLKLSTRLYTVTYTKSLEDMISLTEQKLKMYERTTTPYFS